MRRQASRPSSGNSRCIKKSLETAALRRKLRTSGWRSRRCRSSTPQLPGTFAALLQSETDITDRLCEAGNRNRSHRGKTDGVGVLHQEAELEITRHIKNARSRAQRVRRQTGSAPRKNAGAPGRGGAGARYQTRRRGLPEKAFRQTRSNARNSA